MSFSTATRPILSFPVSAHPRFTRVRIWRVRSKREAGGPSSPTQGGDASRVNLLTGRGRLELDLALAAADLLDSHLDRVAEPIDAPAAAADQGGAQRVQLEVVAREPARRHEALEDVLEQREQPRRDQADDLAL